MYASKSTFTHRNSQITSKNSNRNNTAKFEFRVEILSCIAKITVLTCISWCLWLNTNTCSRIEGNILYLISFQLNIKYIIHFSYSQTKHFLWRNMKAVAKKGSFEGFSLAPCVKLNESSLFIHCRIDQLHPRLWRIGILNQLTLSVILERDSVSK